MALTVPASLALKTGATLLATLLARLPRPASRAQLLIRWTPHLCHAAPWKTSEMARLRPVWASEVTSSTPWTPRARRPCRKPSHES